MLKRLIFVSCGQLTVDERHLGQLIQQQIDARTMELPKFPGGIQVERPRNYGEEAPLFSHLKDNLWAAAALLTPGPVAIDRWVISQLVYAQLRFYIIKSKI